MKKYLMFQDEVSHKFWEIQVIENKQVISFGRVGSVGTIKEKVFSTSESCLFDSLKAINDKIKKGYLEIEKSIKINECENTTPNDKISNYLKAQLDSYKSKLKVLPNLAPVLSDLFQKLEQFDFEIYKKTAEKEIEHNLTEWWANPSKWVNPDEIIYSILFEYDLSYFAKDVEALAYGIVSWENFRLHTKGFDMGYNYDFAAGFEAVPGITLNFLDNLEKLDRLNLSEDIDIDELFDTEGYQELLKTYIFSGLVALNEVFCSLDKKDILKKIKSKKGFMFIIGEHDMGEVFPIYSI